MLMSHHVDSEGQKTCYFVSSFTIRCCSRLCEVSDISMHLKIRVAAPWPLLHHILLKLNIIYSYA